MQIVKPSHIPVRVPSLFLLLPTLLAPTLKYQLQL